ncbi:gluconate 2-dehydrogenase subunit 3 family protein [Paenibacillus sp. N3.4]|uniref:gluconate 2-dehydrogenase subunit 3 family protein n=1 Tax=Paenibacillus sp. N3.4 TaxID=2603222 RepID=UPI0011C87D23|nr:gluconate 2-dehydrogenase subunit 3 family protein [Paenibacillus sp. N3.4]TXK83664.1 gluconate 2-dehydrogenase subunit 3 family protein [Paenibacillus sp. N3.4]
MTMKSHYPSYNVMDEQNEWDSHTQSIVNARLHREYVYRFLIPLEAETLRAWCSLLVDDNRGNLIQFVLCHIDHTLAVNKGEGQRKLQDPPAQILVRKGLKAIDEAGWTANTQPFFQMDHQMQRRIMQQVSEGAYPATEAWDGIPQTTLFQKLLTLTIEAYYSHPVVWSEIGFGGPAYPRGYVRTEPGQLDPWEAVKHS